MSEELIRVVTSFPHAGEPACKIKLSNFDTEIEEPCVVLECNSDVSDALIEQGSGFLYIMAKCYCDNEVDIRFERHGGRRGLSIRGSNCLSPWCPLLA